MMTRNNSILEMVSIFREVAAGATTQSMAMIISGNVYVLYVMLKACNVTLNII